MEIGIDFSRGPQPLRTGTEEYAYELVKALCLLDTRGDTFFLYTKPETRLDFSLPDNFVWRPLGSVNQRFWTERALARELKQCPVEALLVPANIIPSVHPLHSVVMIHGLEYEKVPAAYSFIERARLKLATALNLRRAYRILVPSVSTRKDLEEIKKVPAAKVSVIPHGISPFLIPEKTPCQGFNIFFIGRLEKRKNLLRAIGAFEKFIKRRRGAGDKTSIRLILAGKDGWGAAAIHRRIQNSPCQNLIQTPGFVDEIVKAKLYAQADLFFFPSLYEGFGLPVLEAFVAGVPVLTSNLSALPEIAQNAACLVDPWDEKALADALEKLYLTRELRENMIKCGQVVAARYSWEECARTTLIALKS